MRKSPVLLTLVVLLAALALPMTASAQLGELSLISRADGLAGAQGDNTSYLGDRSISADGRYVVFASYSQNLGGPVTAARNIYRRDTLLGRTELVSRMTGLNGTAGNDVSFGASISASGDRIAFVSGADNLSVADDDAYNNIFVRDMSAGTTTLASRASGVAGPAANGSSLIPSISGNGNVVGFQSAAANLDPTVTDNNMKIDAFVRDLNDSTTRLVSKSSGNVLGNDLTSVADLSYDGNLVAMNTQATTLGGSIAAMTESVYLRNRSAGTTTLISQPTGTTNVGGNASSSQGTITDSGDRVAFVSAATTFAADAQPNRYEVYVRDLASATTKMVSRTPAGVPADSDALDGVISSDGSILTYRSSAANLGAPVAGVSQSFVLDLVTGQTELVSRAGRTGAPANLDTYDVTPGRTSRFVVFGSSSNNLSPDSSGADIQLFFRDVKVVDPIPPTTISGKSFKSKLSKKSFSVKATTGGGATGIAGRATIRVSKKIVKSGKIVVKLKARTVAATLTSHKLRFTLSKKQNRRALKALKTKKTRLKVSIELTATGAGAPGAVKFSGKLRR